MNTKLILPLVLIAASCLRAESPATPAQPASGSVTTKESVSKSESSSSTASASAMADGKGRAFTVTRQKDANGKETVTVTLMGKNGKPKVETLTPEEFEKKYGDRRRKRPATPATPEATAPKSQPSASNPSPAAE